MLYSLQPCAYLHEPVLQKLRELSDPYLNQRNTQLDQSLGGTHSDKTKGTEDKDNATSDCHSHPTVSEHSVKEVEKGSKGACTSSNDPSALSNSMHLSVLRAVCEATLWIVSTVRQLALSTALLEVSQTFSISFSLAA